MSNSKTPVTKTEVREKVRRFAFDNIDFPQNQAEHAALLKKALVRNWTLRYLSDPGNSIAVVVKTPDGRKSVTLYLNRQGVYDIEFE